ncbi:Forkhead-associated (FHA) domain-containing protein [Cynara cardunculus var. scolymus]|uniref:Forkhead-associated (FHA) domain-containing protein n=1 Tax=Cynara cardunculus var. scolymus TaxID=59895 RepID=A0A118K1C3_CYNCS|nr:Forkhead-associated (FHA) domain-containing protein [Cynara cardunculus var. scolymus]
MTTDMGPPPPRNPTTTTTSDQTQLTETPTKTVDDMKKTPMGPPPPIPLNIESEKSVQPKEPQLPEDSAVATADNSTTVEEAGLSESKKEEQKPSSNVGSGGLAVPYTIPSWSEPPCHNYFLEVLKDGSIIDQFDVHEKGAYMFGRVDLCDFVLEHPTISRFHAVLQFNKSGGAFLYDLSSTHGTFINKNQVKKKVYVELHEKDLKSIRNLKMRDESRDMEASLLRAKREAALADGISWGMDEDAVEENEDDLEEITWQTFKGQLTEKQEKTREKIANMKKEIDAIRAKDISQGGLTQGQQTQIARNEQRMAQVAEELENLEETLNESIRESMGARIGRVHDEFYDRTRKKPSKQKGAESQSIETADSLLDKKDAINREIEEKKKLLVDEKNRVIADSEDVGEAGDVLDAFMSGLSSQLVHDKTNSLQKELDELQSELERVLYLLKIADPAGEAARKRESVAGDGKPNIPKIPVVKKPSVEKHSRHKVEETAQKQGTTNITTISNTGPDHESAEVVTKATETKATVYTVTKPQWLGAVETKEPKKAQEAPMVVVESEQFVDYKNRKEVLGKKENAHVNEDSELENAAPGLIIRKRKPVEEPENVKVGDSDSVKSSVGVDIAAEDAVALLLKHTRGIQALDDEDSHGGGEGGAADNQGKKGKKKAKKNQIRMLFNHNDIEKQEL